MNVVKHCEAGSYHISCETCKKLKEGVTNCTMVARRIDEVCNTNQRAWNLLGPNDTTTIIIGILSMYLQVELFQEKEPCLVVESAGYLL